MTASRRRSQGVAGVAHTVTALGSWKTSLLVVTLSWLWRHRLAVALTLVAAMVFLSTGSPLAGAAVLVLGAGAALYLRRPASSHWWDHDNLSTALVDAGVLRRDKDGALPTLSYRGKPVHTDHGTTVAVGLPQAKCLGDVAGRHGSLAAALRAPVARLEVTQDVGDPANVVRIRVGQGVPKGVTATVVTAERTRWHDPVRIGADTRGEAVMMDLDQHNTLATGMMGYGKTRFARIPLSHSLLDPDATVYALDGKGSRKDYGDCRDLCAQFVSGGDETAVEDTFAMFREVFGLIRARNAADDGRTWPGVLLLLEEYQDVRAEASKAQRADLDIMLARIERMGRAVSVHTLICTQRPTVDDVPANARNIIDQRFLMKCRNIQDAILTLGEAPGLPLPTKVREGIYANAAGMRSVPIVDGFTDEQWRAVCKRARKLREAVPALESAGEWRGSGSPVVAEVVSILHVVNPKGLTASELHERLSPDAQAVAVTPRGVGLILSTEPDRVVRGHVGSARVWRLPEAGDQSASLP